MHTNKTRRLLTGFVATAVCTAATIAAGVAPAHAAASGYVLTKGTGSVYSGNSVVNQGAVPGGDPRTFSYKIVNTGATSQQFKVTVPAASPAGAVPTLLQGSTTLPIPYYTAPVAPGGSLVFTLRVKLNAGLPQGEYAASFQLRDPETNTVLDSAGAILNATYQTGNTARDLFLKTGTQPLVGGSFGPQFETANALKVGNTATFSLRLQNNSGSPAAIRLDDIANIQCPSNFSVVVKQGTANVTAAVLAGTYSTGILGPGAKKELKVLIKLVSPSACTGVYFGFTASGPSGGVTQYAHVITAA